MRIQIRLIYKNFVFSIKLKIYNQNEGDTNVNLRLQVTPIDLNRYEYVVTAFNNYFTSTKRIAHFSEPVSLNEGFSFTIDKTQYFSKKDISNTTLLIELNKVKQPTLGPDSVYNLSAKVVGSDTEIPVGIARFRTF